MDSGYSDSEGGSAGVNDMYPPPQIGSFNQPYNNRVASAFTGSFEDEPPLLEELGINFPHIMKKSYAVLNVKQINSHIMDDTDLAGPLVFCLLMGFFLLLTGKIHFGYIYGVGAIGCVSIYLLLNLMSESDLDIYQTIGVLGYCLLPLVILSGLSIILPLNGKFGFVISSFVISWCTFSATRMFVSVLGMRDQTVLVMYPVGLVYTCFGLLTVF